MSLTPSLLIFALVCPKTSFEGGDWNFLYRKNKNEIWYIIILSILTQIIFNLGMYVYICSAYLSSIFKVFLKNHIIVHFYQIFNYFNIRRWLQKIQIETWRWILDNYILLQKAIIDTTSSFRKWFFICWWLWPLSHFKVS